MFSANLKRAFASPSDIEPLAKLFKYEKEKYISVHFVAKSGNLDYNHSGHRDSAAILPWKVGAGA